LNCPSSLDAYLETALEHAGEGEELVLTDKASVLPYLAVAHALQGKEKRLI
jgi:hypothetical protein